MIVVWLKHYYSTINSSSLSYHLKTRAIRMTDRTQRWRNTTLRRAVRGEVRAQPSHGVMDVDEGCCDTSTSLPCLPVACTCTNKAAVHTLIDKLFNIPLSQGSRVLCGWDQLFNDHAEVFDMCSYCCGWCLMAKTRPCLLVFYSNTAPVVLHT